MTEREIIRTDDGLRALCDELRAAGRFALDTEFIGERSYIPRLCLVQIATTEFIALVDTLAVKDLAPLWALVADPTIEKVLHAAREDLRLAYYGAQRPSSFSPLPSEGEGPGVRALLPAGVFDTQVAAGFIGLPQYPLSYARLVEALFGVKLGKGETRSEWDRRPLSPDQIRYARDDVRYLLPAADKLGSLLERLGRAGWMGEEMARFSDPRTYEPDPDLAYLRLRVSRSGFNARATGHLRALAAWRERTAAAQDTPARALLRDEALTELAQRPPRRLTDFARLRNFPQNEDVTLGPPILDILNGVRALPEDQLPPALASAQDEPTPAQQALADLLYALGETLCLNRDLAPELVLSRADSLALARGDIAATLLNGWRRQAVGEELGRLATGEGQAQVSVAGGVPQVTIR